RHVIGRECLEPEHLGAVFKCYRRPVKVQVGPRAPLRLRGATNGQQQQKDDCTKSSYHNHCRRLMDARANAQSGRMGCAPLTKFAPPLQLNRYLDPTRTVSPLSRPSRTVRVMVVPAPLVVVKLKVWSPKPRCRYSSRAPQLRATPHSMPPPAAQPV